MNKHAINVRGSIVTSKGKRDISLNSESVHLLALIITIEHRGKVITLPYCRTVSNSTLIDSIRFIINDMNDRMLKRETFIMPSYFIPKQKRLMSSIHNFIDTNIDLYFKSCESSLPYKLVDYKVMTTERYSTQNMIVHLLKNLTHDDVKDYLSKDVRNNWSSVEKNIITYIVKCTVMTIILNRRPLIVSQLQTLYQTLSTILIDYCSQLSTKIEGKNKYRMLVSNIKHVTLKSIVSYANLLFANGDITEDSIVDDAKNEEYKLDICEIMTR